MQVGARAGAADRMTTVAVTGGVLGFGGEVPPIHLRSDLRDLAVVRFVEDGNARHISDVPN